MIHKLGYRGYVEHEIRRFKESGGEEELVIDPPKSAEEKIILLDIMLKEAEYLNKLWDNLFKTINVREYF